MSVRIHKPWFRSPVVIYDCPHCGSPLKSPVAEIGIEDYCPQCDGGFVVPGKEEYEAYTAATVRADVSVAQPVEKSPEYLEALAELVQVASENDLPKVVSEQHPTTPEKWNEGWQNRRPVEPKVPFSYEPMRPLPHGFDFDREVEERLNYYKRFPYFSTLLIDDPNIVLGVPSDTCPYCGMESKKATCKHCGQTASSRSSVQNYKVWVKIRDEWAQTIDEQRTGGIGDPLHNSYLAGIRLRAAIMDVLVAAGETHGAETQAEFLALDRERREYAKQWLWGLYCSATMEQAKCLDTYATKNHGEDVTRDRLALEKFMEVCYLDLNGANNSNPEYARDREMLRLSPPWDRKMADAPMACCIADRRGDMSKDDVKRLFLEVAERVQKEVGCPVKPTTAWNKLVKAMREAGEW